MTVMYERQCGESRGVRTDKQTERKEKDVARNRYRNRDSEIENKCMIIREKEKKKRERHTQSSEKEWKENKK